MHLELSSSKFPRKSLKIEMNVAEKTSLITAWMLIKPNLQTHARNIFAHFYEVNPQYLHLFNMESLHSHSEFVLQFLTSLIDDGLNNDCEVFDCIMEEIVKHHRHNITRQDVEKLNEIINDYVLKVLKRHMTRTLREAIEKFLLMIESKFKDTLQDVNDEEI